MISIFRKPKDLSGFAFRKDGSGSYIVTYASDNDAKHGRLYTRRITDMQLIDDTLHSDQPKQKDIDHLRRLVKRNGMVRTK